MLKLDNTTVVAYTNHKGGMQSAACNKLAIQIWERAIQRDIWISASHIPMVKNTVADSKSRIFSGNKEWSLNPKVFDFLCKKFGKPDVDLSASRLNAK